MSNRTSVKKMSFNLKSPARIAKEAAQKAFLKQQAARGLVVIPSANNPFMPKNMQFSAPRMAASSSGQMFPSTKEIKFFDVTVANAGANGIPDTPNVVPAEPAVAFSGLTCINEVRQGATAFNRIGSKIVIKSIDLKFTYSMGGSGADHVIARVLLIYDRAPNGAFPTIGTIFSQNIGTAPQFNTGINMSNKSRFSIIRDTYLDGVIDTETEVGTVCEFCKGRWEVEYKADAGDIGDIATGAIYLVGFVPFGTYTGAVNNIQLQNIQTRIRYFD